MNLRAWFCKHTFTELKPHSRGRVFLCSTCGELRTITVPCVHQWLEIDHRELAPMNVGRAYYDSTDTLLRIMEFARGGTVILYRCTVCSEHYTFRSANADDD